MLPPTGAEKTRASRRTPRTRPRCKEAAEAKGVALAITLRTRITLSLMNEQIHHNGSRETPNSEWASRRFAWLPRLASYRASSNMSMSRYIEPSMKEHIFTGMPEECQGVHLCSSVYSYFIKSSLCYKHVLRAIKS